jgi:putative ABC transport system permease protein
LFLVSRASWRFFLHHPWQLGLALLGVALGVAVVVSIDVARDSAERAFALSTQAIAGKATHRIVGGPGGLEESFYTRLRVMERLRSAAPVVAGYATLPDHLGETLQILGVDPFAEGPFRDYGQATGATSRRRSEGILRDFMTRPGAALISKATGARLGLEPGRALWIRVGATKRTIHLIGWLIPAEETPEGALDNLLVTDIATAQEILGMTGRLSHIDLILATEAAGLDRIRALLPRSAEIEPAGAQSQAIQQMTRAFHINLIALGLLALLVGAFLIYNTMGFVVVQRRFLIGVLRAIGVSRSQVFRMVLGEALALGAAGTAIGLGLGMILGESLTGLVTRTINDFYFVLTVRETEIEPLTFVKGITLGVGASLLAALAPAWEAAGVPPCLAMARSHLESRLGHWLPRVAVAGAVSIALGFGIIILSERGIVSGFAALFAILFGCVLATPFIVAGLMQALVRLVPRGIGVLWRLAIRSVTASLSRTAFAIAALMVAVATVVGIGLMIGSFRLAVTDWLGNILRADLYVSVPERTTGAPVTQINRELAQRLAKAPGVAALSHVLRLSVATPQGPANLAVYRMAPRSYGGFRFREEDQARIWHDFEQGQAVIVSEPYAYHHSLHVGDKVSLSTEQGIRDFTIAGVYVDYSTDQGVVAMSRRTFDRYWNIPGLSSIGVYAQPGVADETLRATIRDLLDPNQSFLITPTRRIREESMRLFDRTFAVTEVLQILAGVIAFAGIMSSLMALQLERSRELGVLRATGVTPGQLGGIIMTETGLMGLIAGLMALPVGAVIAGLLVFVLNRRSFGWSMDLHLDPLILAQGLALAVIAAVLAGIYPALCMARTSPAEALRTE